MISYGERVLGCRSISPIWMSYYVDGCAQELHCGEGVTQIRPPAAASASFPPCTWQPLCNLIFCTCRLIPRPLTGWLPTAAALSQAQHSYNHTWHSALPPCRLFPRPLCVCDVTDTLGPARVHGCARQLHTATFTVTCGSSGASGLQSSTQLALSVHQAMLLNNLPPLRK